MLYAFPANNAFLSVTHGLAGPAVHFYRARWAGIHTGGAAGAFMGINHELRLTGQRLGVLTPNTAQRATFEEDSVADAWSIMNTICLNIEDWSTYISVRFHNKILLCKVGCVKCSELLLRAVYYLILY